MQKIAIIGGTGTTGECVVDSALKKGLLVRLLYRNEINLTDEYKSKVELVEGDGTNLNDILTLLKDSNVDTVCVILGSPNTLTSNQEMSTTTQNVIDAMKLVGLKRFCVVFSSFQFWDQCKNPSPYLNINAEHMKMLDLTKNSGLEYIAIFPPHTAEELSTSLPILHKESVGNVVSKLDLGKFIVDCLDQPDQVI